MNDLSLVEVLSIVEANNPGFLRDTKIESKDDLEAYPITLVILLVQSDQTVVAKAANINITERIIESIEQKSSFVREVSETVTPRRLTIHLFVDDDMHNREVVSI
ncbi:MAG TPA: hypothetical protein VNN20_03420 [Thermodesulfobacteriota bacterium]|nr:hypothetical protein [Thermodesulfobacteriota bacterium]